MSASRFRTPSLTQQEFLTRVEVRLLGGDEAERSRFRELMSAHHYLKSDTLVGGQLRYVAHVDGQWVALLSWSAAAYHLKDREAWIGWDTEHRRRRLALLANNARFLILPKTPSDCEIPPRRLSTGMMTTAALVDEALALPLADRSYVAERLLQSLEDEHPISDEWREEIARRVARRERGESRPFSQEEVRRDVQALLS